MQATKFDAMGHTFPAECETEDITITIVPHYSGVTEIYSTIFGELYTQKFVPSEDEDLEWMLRVYLLRALYLLRAQRKFGKIDKLNHKPIFVYEVVSLPLGGDGPAVLICKALSTENNITN